MIKFGMARAGSVLLILLGTVVGAASGNNIYAASEPCAFPYIVSNGDWLSRIAARLLGDLKAYSQIVDATNAQNGADGFTTITDPNKIEEGAKLCIPQLPKAPSGLELSVLANAAYKSDLGESGTVTLQDAVWKHPVGDGSPSFEMMVLEEVAYGKIGGTETAAVVTWDSGGGTARLYNLRLTQVRDGALDEIATLEIGDRIFINWIQFKGEAIVIDMVEQDRSSADCCPTRHVVNTFALQDGALKLVSKEKAASQ